MAVFMPRCSATTARWMATVVLPAPPFWLIIAIVFISDPVCFRVLEHTRKQANDQAANPEALALPRQPPFRDEVLLRIKFHAYVAAAEHLGGAQGAAGTGEGIEHGAGGRGECFHERQKHRKRLLRRMQFVAAVGLVDHIAYRIGRCFRITLG
jgi:hypothetical protein